MVGHMGDGDQTVVVFGVEHGAPGETAAAVTKTPRTHLRAAGARMLAADTGWFSAELGGRGTTERS